MNKTTETTKVIQTQGQLTEPLKVAQPQGQPSEPSKAFTTIDAYTLLQQNFPPLQFAVEQILPHGLFILAGSSKIGKSWLSLDICRAVATGDMVWGFSAPQGEVLYLALEDNYRRLYNRLHKIGLMVADEKTTSARKNIISNPEGIANPNVIRLAGFHMTTSAFGITSGLIEQVHHFMAQHPRVKLLVIDTLERVRDTELDKGIYACDYRDMTALREITNQYHLTLLLIHHTRKMNDKDPLNTLSGSTGLTGAVDGVFVLQKEKRIGNKAVLTIVNRDTEDFCFNLEFNKENCTWAFRGTRNENDSKLEESNEDLESAKNEWLCLLVDDFLENEWTGTATELANALNDIDGGSNTCISHLNIKRQLIANTELLLKSGIAVAEWRNESERLIKLSRQAK